MKVLILSTFGSFGGASVCSRRLAEAMERHGVEVKLASIHKYHNTIAQPISERPRLTSLYAWWLFCLERLVVLFSISKLKYLYKFSSSSFGVNILQNPLIQEADIIHLHWVNFGFLSIENIAELARSKPIVWTLHDMWAFTGGCHYALQCSNYKELCNDCFYLRNTSLAKKIQAKKERHWQGINMTVVGTSHWLAECAMQSSVFNNKTIGVLSTPIDTNLFKPNSERNSLRQTFGLDKDKFYILVGAVDLADERKGLEYLIDAIEEAQLDLPNLHILTFGLVPEGIFSHIPHTSFGSISDQEKLVEIYNLADIFMLTSIQDNLPNTVMEALSCGVPVVAFDCGGVNDMIDHKINGYLAKNRKAIELIEGIKYFLDKDSRVIAGQSAREKVVNTYSEEIIVNQHLDEYHELLTS